MLESTRIQPKARGATAAWTPRLGKSFTQVSRFFLDHFHKLLVVPVRGKSARGMNSTEAMTIVLLISHKWDKNSPFPSLSSIAGRLGIELRSARDVVRGLEQSGYIQREAQSDRRTNKYHLDGLFQKLEELMDKVVEQNDADDDDDIPF